MKRLRLLSLSLCVLVGVLGLARPMVAAADDEDAWLGVSTQSLTESLRKGIRYTGDGVLVNRVVEDSPADRAGIQKGDVIVTVNTTTVRTPEELTKIVRGAREGQTVRVVVVRDSQRKSFDVTLGSREDANVPEVHVYRDDDDDHDGDHYHSHSFDFPGANVFVRGAGRGRLGVRIEDLNPDLGDYFGVKDGKGVLVVEVMKDTPAERAGLKAGDIITSVGGHAVSDASDLVDELGNVEGKTSIQVVRKGAKRTIEAELDKARVYRFRSDHGSRAWTFPDKSIRIVTPEDSKQLRDEMQQLRDEVRTLREQLDRQNHD
jgi:C-terminal processing protease CtpA/Prc